MNKIRVKCNDGKMRVVRPYRRTSIKATMAIHGKTITGFIHMSGNGFDFIPSQPWAEIWVNPKSKSKIEARRNQELFSCEDGL